MIPVMMLAITADESYPALNKILDDKLVNVLNRVDGSLLFAVVDAGNPCAEGVQTPVDVLVAAVDLVDVLDRRDPLGRHGLCPCEYYIID